MGGWKDTIGCISRSTTNRKTKHDFDPTKKKKRKTWYRGVTRWEKISLSLVLYVVVVFFLLHGVGVSVLRKNKIEINTTVFFCCYTFREVS